MRIVFRAVSGIVPEEPAPPDTLVLSGGDLSLSFYRRSGGKLEWVPLGPTLIPWWTCELSANACVVHCTDWVQKLPPRVVGTIGLRGTLYVMWEKYSVGPIQSKHNLALFWTSGRVDLLYDTPPPSWAGRIRL